MGSKAWQIAVTVPLGRAADRPELILQPYDLLELFPLLCVHRQLALANKGIRESIHKVAPAPGKPFDYGRFELIHEPFDFDLKGDRLLGMPVDKLVALTRNDLSALSDAQIRKRLRVL